MELDRAELVDQLDNLIFQAEVAWRLPSGKHAGMVRTFRLVGQVHEAAAQARLNGRPVFRMASRLGGL
jgi:hypothetical protein